MYYYKFHIGDYKRATDHLTNEEDIAYRRLLDMYYETEKPISLDTHWVSRRLRVAKESIDIVLKDFFVETEEGWTQTYCDKSIAEYHSQAERNRKNGKGGGRPKKENNPAGSESHPVGNPTETLTINHKPLTINHKPNIKEVAPPNGVLVTVWQDFVQQRKAKKAVITQTAIKGIEREAQKAGITLNDALQEICARGWTGFKAEWLQTAKQSEPTWAKEKREWYEEANW